MPKQKEQMNLATEIIWGMKKRLIAYRIALGLSLAGNIILAVLILR